MSVLHLYAWLHCYNYILNSGVLYVNLSKNRFATFPQNIKSTVEKLPSKYTWNRWEIE